MTSTTEWPFPWISFPTPYEETRLRDDDVIELGRGITVARENLPEPGFSLQVRGSVRFKASQTLKSWQDWIETYGSVTGFLFRAADLVGRTDSNFNANREVVDEAVGTGDNSTTAFTLDMRHIDASTLVVKVDGVTQTGGGTDYTLSGNNSAPTITFTSAPASSLAITASYEYLWPMRLVSWEPTRHSGGAITGVSNITLREEQAGLHRA